MQPLLLRGLAFGLLASLWGACSVPQDAAKDPPAAPATTYQGSYVPADLDDALRVLDELLAGEVHAAIAAMASDETIRLHRGVGMQLRNRWGLWADSRLARWFQERGIEHPDDMSSVVLTSYWRQLHRAPVDLEGQVARRRGYWERWALPEDRACPEDGSHLAIWASLSRQQGEQEQVLHLGRCARDHVCLFERGDGWRLSSGAEVEGLRATWRITTYNPPQ